MLARLQKPCIIEHMDSKETQMKTLHCYQIFYIVTCEPGSMFVMDDFGDLVKIEFPLLNRFYMV
jgi:hypothetical protein